MPPATICNNQIRLTYTNLHNNLITQYIVKTRRFFLCLFLLHKKRKLMNTVQGCSIYRQPFFQEE